MDDRMTVLVEALGRIAIESRSAMPVAGEMRPILEAIEKIATEALAKFTKCTK